MLHKRDQLILEQEYVKIFHRHILKEGQFQGSYEELQQTYRKKIVGNYTQFVLWLKEYSDDPRLQQIVSAGASDGDATDDVLKGENIDVPVAKLLPTQKEIGVPDSLAWPMKNPSALANLLKTPVDVGGRALILNGRYVLDGHHRWSQAFCYNPNAVLPCINYDNSNFGEPTMGLKAIQAGIEALKNSQTVLATADALSPNLLNCSIDDIIQSTKSLCSPDFLNAAVKVGFIDAPDQNKFYEKLYGNVQKLRSIINAKDAVANNPSRSVMPQPGMNNVADGELKGKLERGEIDVTPPFSNAEPSQNKPA